MKPTPAKFLGIDTSGMNRRTRLAAFMVLCLEAKWRQIELGLDGPGYRPAGSPKWSEVTRAEFQRHEDAIAMGMQCVAVVMLRLSERGAARALRLIQQRPSCLTEGERLELILAIRDQAFNPDETQQKLHRDWKSRGKRALVVGELNAPAKAVLPAPCSEKVEPPPSIEIDIEVLYEDPKLPRLALRALQNMSPKRKAELFEVTAGMGEISEERLSGIMKALDLRERREKGDMS